ncbi:hypothetical protein ILUMI_21178 [Ignelater luminosus]|uniref:Transposase n=1 Tax=Ignelater luminosus TaxID=2038154 RepID=A0A8K0CF26_IGNLU|nr:hypothetical protein ILUMI_21178 [Ignelater luminosus]
MKIKKKLSSEIRSSIVTLSKKGESIRKIAKFLRISKRAVQYDAFIIMSKRNRRLTAPEITADLNSRREHPVSKIQVLWSDESKFEIIGSKRRVYVRRSVEEKISDECAVGTVKHGGCFGNNKTGDLHRIEGTLNKEGYKKIA